VTRTFTHDETGTPAAAWRRTTSWSAVSRLELVDRDGTPCDRLVVLAAHPDDECLGAGGLVHVAAARGLAVDVIVATQGEHSHPRSPTHPPSRLAALRRVESEVALHLLAPGATPTFLGLVDGRLADEEDGLVDVLVSRIGDGRRTLLVAPWRDDGHPDHDAAGRAAAVAAHRTGARLLEHPVWSWHWRDAGDLPWPRARRLELTTDVTARKREALAAHRTQVAPLSPAAGDETLLLPGFLAHFDAGDETFLELPTADDALDDLHRAEADPWGVDRRWYEERKRALLLALLPARRFARAWEAGCSTGALTQALATRCDHVVATDASAAALEAVRGRLGDVPGVELRLGDVAAPQPGASYDLVVVSEVGYFLSPAGLERLVDVVGDATTPDAVVVLCHWRHPVVGWPLDGADVHAAFRDHAAARGRHPLAAYVDRDVELLLLGPADALPRPGE